MMSFQTVFDKAIGGVLAQGGPAFDQDTCMYRTSDGRACSIGQLFPDDTRSDILYFMGDVVNLVLFFGLESIGGLSVAPKEHANRSFLIALQVVHDNAEQEARSRQDPNSVEEYDKLFLKSFREKAKRLANKWNLDWRFD